MRSFKDKEGIEWNLEITVGTVKRVRTLVGVDLMEAVNGKLVEQMASDPIILVDVIYAVAKPQADERGITDEVFGASMGGDCIGDATTAFLEALVDFFPAPRRGLLAKICSKMKKLEAMAFEAADEKLDSGEIEQEMRNAIAGVLSSSSPVPSESTPTP